MISTTSLVLLIVAGLVAWRFGWLDRFLKPEATAPKLEELLHQHVEEKKKRAKLDQLLDQAVAPPAEKKS